MYIQPPLITETELISFSGLVTLVVVITQSLRYAFNLDAKWVGLVVSFTVASVSTFLTTDNTVRSWLLMVANAFVIYLGSVGIAEIGAALDGPRRRPSKQSAARKSTPEETKIPEKTFWGGWFAR
jgi:hypothetical protein